MWKSFAKKVRTFRETFLASEGGEKASTPTKATPEQPAPAATPEA